MNGIYHIPDSSLNLLNGYDFYFRCKPPIKAIEHFFVVYIASSKHSGAG